MFTQLPVELIREIIGYVDDKVSLEGLFTVSNERVKSLIAPILYKKIKVVMMMMDVEFFGRDIRNTRLRVTENGGWAAPFVECLSIFPEAGPASDEEVQRYIEDVLPILCNLKKLRFIVYGERLGMHFLKVAKRLAIAPFPFSLTHLIWDDDIIHIDAFAAFLGTQPQLLHMELASDCPALQLPNGSLPNLKVLQGSRDVAFGILPGRNVMHLRVDSLGVSFPETIGAELEEAFRGIRSLQCSGYYLSGPFEVVRRFSNLEYLRIHDTDLLMILDYISILHTTNIGYLQVFSREMFQDEQSLLPNVFDALDSLMVIDVRTDPAKDIYARSRRGADALETVHIPATTWEPWCHGCRLDDSNAGEDSWQIMK